MKYDKMYKEDIMNRTTVIIGLIFLVLIFLLYVLILVLKKKKRNFITTSIDRLTTEKNLIISASLMTELSKSEKLVNNKKIGEDVENWKERFKELEEVDLPKLTDELIEVENYAVENDYVNAYKYLNKTEKDIYHVKAKSNKLLGEIKELTESEDRNREAITKLKNK